MYKFTSRGLKRILRAFLGVLRVFLKVFPQKARFCGLSCFVFLRRGRAIGCELRPVCVVFLYRLSTACLPLVYRLFTASVGRFRLLSPLLRRFASGSIVEDASRVFLQIFPAENQFLSFSRFWCAGSFSLLLFRLNREKYPLISSGGEKTAVFRSVAC